MQPSSPYSPSSWLLPLEPCSWIPYWIFFSSTLQSWFGKGESWFRGFAQFLGGSLILVISYFFFAGIHGAFVGIFIDDILDAVHQKHYPEEPWQKPPAMMQSILFSGRILVMTFALNLLASPLLILGWFIPPTRPFLTNYSQWLFTWKRVRTVRGISYS